MPIPGHAAFREGGGASVPWPPPRDQGLGRPAYHPEVSLPHRSTWFGEVLPSPRGSPSGAGKEHHYSRRRMEVRDDPAEPIAPGPTREGHAGAPRRTPPPLRRSIRRGLHPDRIRAGRALSGVSGDLGQGAEPVAGPRRPGRLLSGPDAIAGLENVF